MSAAFFAIKPPLERPENRRVNKVESAQLSGWTYRKHFDIMYVCLSAQECLKTPVNSRSWLLASRQAKRRPQQRSAQRILPLSHWEGLAAKKAAEHELKSSHNPNAPKLRDLPQGRAGTTKMTNLPLLDQAIFLAVNAAEEEIENALNCDLIYFYGEIRPHIFQFFRNFVEELAARPEKKSALAICLKTPGGSAETVEKLVDVARYHYSELYFIVPDMAMSAGTIFCMAGDKIYMDYSSSLGPIDPQVPDKEDKFLIPALGYLDYIESLILKSADGSITPVEFAIVEKQDLAMLNFYEQARDLSVALLKKWLCTYKFKNWNQHRTTNPGTPVTTAQKEQRATETAELLANNKHWHSHGRMIGMDTLIKELRLEIDDFGALPALQKAIRKYNDTLSDWLMRNGAPFFMHSRHLNKNT
jgi:hypothetical protein